MPGRIITLQRQARELGRLRTGWSEPYTTRGGREARRPVASKTWLLTSHQRDYLDAAAEEWGGEVQWWEPQGAGNPQWRLITEAEALDAILPPGDPLSQANELWSRGGAQRRCDGQTERLSGKPCLCLAEYGDSWFEQKPDKVCRPHSRLNVILPVLPDLGVWRVESHGYWPANEIAAQVDMIKAAVGDRVMVPVRLRIEPRSRVSQGETKRYPVVVVEIRGAVAGQILAGRVPSLEVEGAPVRQAIEAGPVPGIQPGAGDGLTVGQLLELIPLARNKEQLAQLWADARGVQMTEAQERQIKEAFAARGAKVNGGTDGEPAADTEPQAEPVEGETVPGREDIWMQVMAEAGRRGWDLPTVEQKYRDAMGHDPAEEAATPNMLRGFLDAIRSGEVQ